MASLDVRYQNLNDDDCKNINHSKRLSKRRKFYYWKTGSINVRTLNQKADESKIQLVCNNLDEANIDICGIQECRERGTGNFEYGNYRFYYSGYKKFPRGKAEAGVMIAVKNSKNIEIEQVNYNSARIISLDLLIQGIKLKVVCCYAPTEMGSIEAKDTFWNSLYKETKQLKKRQKLMILGDFNSTTSAIRSHPTYFHGQSLPNTIQNNNGQRLASFLAETKLHVASTYFNHKPAHSYSWYSNDKKTKKIPQHLH